MTTEKNHTILNDVSGMEIEHNGVCEFCGTKTPCLEMECHEPPGHPYTCEKCLEKERRMTYRSDMDALDPVTRFGY